MARTSPKMARKRRRIRAKWVRHQKKTRTGWKMK
jgi:hypothetical protein